MTRYLMIAVALATAAESHAVGYFNMPTSTQQWFGYGVGPGYHAPMILGPTYRAPMAAQRVVRRRHAPAAPIARVTAFGCPTCLDCQPADPAWPVATPAIPNRSGAAYPPAPVLSAPPTGYDLAPSAAPSLRAIPAPLPARR